MNSKQISDSLETIFYSPQYNGKAEYERFYKLYPDENGHAYYKFENETIILLNALYQKLNTDKEKNFFFDALAPKSSQFITRTKHLYKSIDFVFVFFVKLQNLDKAFSFISPTLWAIDNTNKCLYALHELVSLENPLFSDDVLNKILSIVDEFIKLIGGYKSFKIRKRIGVRSGSMTPVWDTEKESLYKSINASAVYECTQLLDKLKDVIYSTKKYRLKSRLLDGINLEVNQDQGELQNLIKSLGFNPDLDEILNKINAKIYAAGDKFDQKECIDLIRSFFNELCVSIAHSVQAKSQKPLASSIGRMGEAMAYLRSKDIAFLDESEDAFFTKFNGFLSCKGVHVLKSEREYARIAKNMAIEIGLFLLERLEKH